LASITFWNRLEPRPRSPSIGESLAARVRDPLWMLTRQWQMGEFQGADAASPAWVEYSGVTSRMTGWRPAATGTATPFQPIPQGVPLERTMLAEPLAPSFVLAVEIGQSFETLLSRAGAPTAIAAFRDAFPLSGASLDPLDKAAARFLAVCAGRSIDGVELARAARTSAPAIPPAVATPTGTEAAVRAALAELLLQIDAIYGPIGAADPPGWRRERLDHALEARTTMPDGASAILAVHPDAEGVLEPSAFDLRTVDSPPQTPSEDSAPEPLVGSMMPTHVRFRGMPNARWWDFERGTTSFGDVQVDKTDVAKLVVLDFMLVHGNDWFVIPLRMPVGSLCRLDQILVHDVFGGLTKIDRATARGGGAGAGWTLFTTSVEGDDARVADWFLLPDGAGAAIQEGDVLEEVRFARDQLASMVWAIEHATENAVGRSWSGDERDVAMGSRELSAPSTSATSGAALAYHVQTSVPANWIPFLPVSLDPSRGLVILEQGIMPRPSPPGPPLLVEPIGKILRPTLPPGEHYRLREQEVPRIGVKVRRAAAFCRWVDGSRHLWITRSRDVGRGEAQSNLRFDLADPGS
jgi:hypothetical protein